MVLDEPTNPLAESGVTMHSDSEQYGEELSGSPGSSGSPVILYQPPTVWSLLRGAAINLVLPFINGMMLGFGELFAHEAAFRLGWGGTKIPSRTFLKNGRQFGTLNASLSSGSAVRASPFSNNRSYVAPIALGGPASVRAFSVWGYHIPGTGKKSTPATPPAESVVPEEVVETASAAKDAATSAVETVAAAPVEAATNTAQAVAESTELSAISDIVNSGAEILSRAEGLGYLKSLGLNYGYGFTSTMQWVLEHVHVWGGVGWGGAIIITGLLMRVAMFYPQVQSVKFSSKMKMMQEDPRHKEVMEQMQKAAREGDRSAQQQAQFLSSILRKEYDVPVTGLFWTFLPIPFSIGLFRILNGMASIPVPSLETAGWLWFQDLSAADPYYALPALATGIMLLTMKLNQVNSTPKQQKMLKTMSYVLVPVMLIATSFLSAAINLMGVTVAAFTMLTGRLLLNNKFRAAMGIPPVVPPAPKPVEQLSYEAPRQQPATIREKLTDNLEDVKKGFSESVTKMTGSVRGTDKDRAERQRKESIQKLEDKRADEERRLFEEKYKRKA
ncbi:unnamed protein product [Clonostachys chloroleuca]|uniref:Membrane insertase YidC/Oxa/ALB C-terminal domain-containing protein n=1 Tax=Clonostachys chloroleuca TaxID=1926264 RepID=A0AA35MGP6_9HYPO|nr:unnamed protein product [Clonostachys chloroleuca]